MLKEKALEIAKVINKNDLKGSNGCLEKFKSRKKILFVTIHGEANSVEPSVIENWYIFNW